MTTQDGKPRDPLRLLMLGAPGSGKGTQGTRLAERYGAPHISTGDLLREQVELGTPAGEAAGSYMRRGDLVPDELILAMVLESVFGRDSSPSYILDGFPRTLAQARAAYEKAVETDRLLDAVICLDISHEVLLERIVQRGLDSGRSDDEPSTVRHRIEEYEEKTLPLLDYYAGRGILLRFDAEGDVDEVFRSICAAIDALPPRD